MIDDRKILQIMPADGWGAIYATTIDAFVVPLVGWALVEDGKGEQAVVGLECTDSWVEMVKDGTSDEDDGFDRYIHKSADVDVMLKESIESQKRMQAALSTAQADKWEQT